MAGEMSEWLKEHAWKACIRGNADRGFESLSLRSSLNFSFLFSAWTGIVCNRVGGARASNGGLQMNILLVDDKKDVLDTMSEILEICHNHDVQGANSGKEALKFIRKKRYDLIVMDLALPVMNGVEIISKIRKIHSKVKIVVLTGISCNEQLREKLKGLDVQKIFIKPRGVHELLLYIKQLQSSHSAA
jgi:CheY-like chemotaxis protein